MDFVGEMSSLFFFRDQGDIDYSYCISIIFLLLFICIYVGGWILLGFYFFHLFTFDGGLSEKNDTYTYNVGWDF